MSWPVKESRDTQTQVREGTDKTQARRIYDKARSGETSKERHSM